MTSNLKIYELPDAGFYKLIDVLAALSGFEKQISSNDKQLLQMFAKNKFGKVTQHDCEQAFMMYAAGELSMKYKAKVLSPKFFADIMVAYKEAERKKASELQPFEDVPQLEAVNTDTDEYHFDLFVKYLKKNEVLRIAMWNQIYNHGILTGQITEPNKEDKAVIYKQAERELKAQNANQRHYQPSAEDVKKQCKKLVVLDWALTKYPSAK